jgi:hypothetical protein
MRLPALSLSLVLALGACTPADEVVFQAPQSVSPAPVPSDLDPAAAAAAIRAAGFSDVSLRDGGRTIRVRTDTPALVDCGEIVQTFMGERSTFPGSAPRAALLAATSTGDVVLRSVDVTSLVDLTLRPEGGYSVSERHDVSLSYSRPSDGAAWRETQVFGRDGSQRFGDGTSCRASGRLARIIG